MSCFKEVANLLVQSKLVNIIYLPKYEAYTYLPYINSIYNEKWQNKFNLNFELSQTEMSLFFSLLLRMVNMSLLEWPDFALILVF